MCVHKRTKARSMKDRKRKRASKHESFELPTELGTILFDEPVSVINNSSCKKNKRRIKSAQKIKAKKQKVPKPGLEPGSYG